MATAFRSLALGFERRGWDVTIITLAPVTGWWFHGTNVRTQSLSTARASSSAFSLARALRDIAPQAVITASHQLSIVAAIVARRAAPVARLIITERSSLRWLHQNAPSTKLKLLSLARKLVYRRAASVVANSHATARELFEDKAVPPEKIEVIFNPVLSAASREAAAQQPTHPWLLEKRGSTIVALGNLIVPKGYDTLIRAISRVRQAQPNARLVIFGEGNQRANLEQLVATLGLGDAVSLPGQVENQYAEIAAADLVVSASLIETFGLTVAEALCLGTPVVAARADGGLEEVLGGGKYGRLVPLRDPEGLADAICETLADPDPSVPAEAGLRFSEDRVLDQWEDLFRRLGISRPETPSS